MYEIAPGNILQYMHIKRRVRLLQKELGRTDLRFCEIGTGKGANSNLLLSLGLTGIGFDLNEGACEQNRKNNQEFIEQGRYTVAQDNFLTSDKIEDQSFDIILSCMVIEHLAPEDVAAYFNRCKEKLSPQGCVITLVPASMKHWGIEDDIAGHFKRYSFKCFEELGTKHHFAIRHISGLTYPISNWLLPLSNYLVNKSEKNKEGLSMQERTELSGNRDVKFKTVYPWYLKVMLNQVTLFPFYILQRIFRKSKRSLVIYNEFVSQ